MAVEVADTGIGIPEPDLPRIFERFYRAANARISEGSGLGLAIAQRIASLHGGRIAVTSRTGIGSAFTVTLPVLATQRERTDPTAVGHGGWIPRRPAAPQVRAGPRSRPGVRPARAGTARYRVIRSSPDGSRCSSYMRLEPLDVGPRGLVCRRRLVQPGAQLACLAGEVRGPGSRCPRWVPSARSSSRAAVAYGPET